MNSAKWLLVIEVARKLLAFLYDYVVKKPVTSTQKLIDKARRK